MSDELDQIIADSGTDQLVCVVWDKDKARLVGRVTLDPGTGLHVVDVTDPEAPTILVSRRHHFKGLL